MGTERRRPSKQEGEAAGLGSSTERRRPSKQEGEAAGLGSSTERRFVDSNVVLYRYDHDEPVKQQLAAELLTAAAPDTLIVSTQVLLEFYAVATRRFATPLGHHDAAAAVERLSTLPTVTTDARLVREAITLCDRAQLSLWDALIVRAAVAGRCATLLTEDLNHGQTIDGVHIHNPFRHA